MIPYCTMICIILRAINFTSSLHWRDVELWMRLDYGRPVSVFVPVYRCQVTILLDKVRNVLQLCDTKNTLLYIWDNNVFKFCSFLPYTQPLKAIWCSYQYKKSVIFMLCKYVFLLWIRNKKPKKVHEKS